MSSVSAAYACYENVYMNLQFRPDMKVIIHDMNGQPIQITGTSLETDSQALVALMDVPPNLRLRLGAKVTCSYVEPIGVQQFESIILSTRELALNERKIRVSLSAPEETERIQRRSHLRVDTDLEVKVFVMPAGPSFRTKAKDLSAGGMALWWNVHAEPTTEDELHLEFSTQRFQHSNKAHVVGFSSGQDGKIAHLEFVDISPGDQNRLVNAVFALHRETISKRGLANPRAKP